MIDKSIIDHLSKSYGIATKTLTNLTLGADMNASVYQVKTVDGFVFFVKLKHGQHDDISSAILTLLETAGIQQIIPPIKTIAGDSSLRTSDFTLIVYPFVKGEGGFDRKLTENQWTELGRTLKSVHEMDVPPFIKNQIGQETYSSKWRDFVRSLDAEIDGKLMDDEIAQKLLAFMKDHRDVIHQLVDRAEDLSQSIKKLEPECVLCHSDLHGGNVLIDENQSIFIVDWDEPIMAPKERDLMFIGGGVGNVWNDPCEEAFFYRGYEKTEINRTILAYYRCERIVVDIAEYADALLLKTSGREERSEMYKHFVSMFEPKGVVEIAFSTEKG